MIELYILKAILSREIFEKYNYLLEERFLHDESEEITSLYRAISAFYKQNPTSDLGTIDSLEQQFHLAYPALPKKKRELISPIFERLRSLELDNSKIEEYFSKLVKKFEFRKLAETALLVSQDKLDEEKLNDLCGRLFDKRAVGDSSSRRNSFLWNNVITSESLEIFNPKLESARRKLTFRQKALQRSLGPLRKGDFGVVFARPEVGKTAFVADLLAHMVPQVETKAVVLANEERAAAPYSRIISSYFGKSRSELLSTPEQAQEYKDEFDRHFRDKLLFIHDPSLNYRDFYRFLKEVKPELIIIDQLDKLKGFDEDRHDLELGQIYNWARQIASEFGPTIGVSQASDSGEGKRWLTQSDMANSKTAKPAEVDWILGIGKTHEEALKNIRHFHIIKNKLDGDENSFEEYRHGKFDMLLRSEISRYEDTGK